MSPAGADFDRTSRHMWAARIVHRLLVAGQRVLEVGGSEGLTAHFLADHPLVVTDIGDRGQVDVVASGTALPFEDRSFGAVIALDTLEHVPQDQRPALLTEMTRVAETAVVLAGPFATEGVEAAEAQMRSFFEALFDQEHPWLSEHRDNGLPDLPSTVAAFEGQGLSVATFTSNPLSLWREIQVANFLAARLGESVAETHRALLDEFLDRGDATPPGYRHLVVATNDPVDVIPPVHDGSLVDPWLERLRAAQGEMIVRALQKAAEQQSALGASVEAGQAGWAETAAEVGRLTEGLQRTRADRERVQAQLAEAERRVERAEEVQANLELQLISRSAGWLSAVAGPPVTAEALEPRPISPLRPQPETVDPGSEITFSVLIPVYNPSAANLTACIRSVRAQDYPDWEVVLLNASDAPHVAPICSRFAQIDGRIRALTGDNLGISQNTNRCADEASGDWFVLLDHDDELAPHALSALAAAINSQPEARFVYSDEDKIDEEGERFGSFFKPDWSPDLLRHVNYITHLQALRRDLWHEVGGLRSDYDGAQDYDLALRASRLAGGALHVPDILYHWRIHEESTALDVTIKPEAHSAGRRALEDFALRYLPGSRVEFGTGPTSHRIRYPLEERLVSMIIPFRDNWALTETCLEAIHRYGSTLPLEILLVDNQSSEVVTAEKVAEWRERFPRVRALSYDQPFNFHKLNNWAVPQAKGDLLLFLNNDVEPLHAGWVEAMAEQAQRDEVGAVGARLFYPNGLIQHAGVAVGIGGYADHPWAGLDPNAWTPAGPSYWTRNYLAVTAACLMVERSKFEAVGGFDERFAVGGGDVALGIALHRMGLWNVYTPFARLVHHESVTRGSTVPTSDLEISKEVYAPFLEDHDPFYNPNLTLWDTSCSIADEEEMRARIPSPVSSFGS